MKFVRTHSHLYLCKEQSGHTSSRRHELRAHEPKPQDHAASSRWIAAIATSAVRRKAHTFATAAPHVWQCARTDKLFSTLTIGNSIPTTSEPFCERSGLVPTIGQHWPRVSTTPLFSSRVGKVRNCFGEIRRRSMYRS